MTSQKEVNELNLAFENYLKQAKEVENTRVELEEANNEVANYEEACRILQEDLLEKTDTLKNYQNQLQNDLDTSNAKKTDLENTIQNIHNAFDFVY